jgi:hypothetical protein
VILVDFVKFELELHGLEAPPSCQHCAPSSWHSCWKYPWWAKPEWKAEVPWLLVEGQRKMLADFVVVNEVAFALGTWQTDRFLMSLFPTIITKEILKRNVALTSFVGRIATVIARR